jgi:hypothetical protein
MLPVVPASKLIILILGAVLVMAPVEKHYDDQIIQIGNNVIDQLVQEVDDNPQQFIQGDHRAYIDYDIVEKMFPDEKWIDPFHANDRPGWGQPNLVIIHDDFEGLENPANYVASDTKNKQDNDDTDGTHDMNYWMEEGYDTENRKSDVTG